jgi:2-iminobutanoate/2-iminopropanoate deaminase
MSAGAPETVKLSNPDNVYPPLGAYTHVVTVPPNSELLFVSGQVGIRSDGVTPVTIGEQADQAYANLVAVLAAHGLTTADIIKTTTFIVAGHDGTAVREARLKHFGAHQPASTTVYVSRLVDPIWLVEIEAIAERSAPGPVEKGP